MKIVVDLNLSPEWCDVLRASGHDAVHWIALGDPRAPDAEIMAWAAANGHVVFTHDLDFSRLLAQARSTAPSVIQVRCLDAMPDTLGPRVLAYLLQFESMLAQGALVVIEPHRARARILPLTAP